MLHSFLNVWIIVQLRARTRGILARGPRGGRINHEIDDLAVDLRKFSEVFDGKASGLKALYYDAEKLMRKHPTYRPYCEGVVEGVRARFTGRTERFKPLCALPFILKRVGDTRKYAA